MLYNCNFISDYKYNLACNFRFSRLCRSKFLVSALRILPVPTLLSAFVVKNPSNYAAIK